MSQLIASTYEIREELGSGGIGTVYLGWHTRLGKKVVLKAEQRTLKTDINELRREVNMLKDLSHTYIPQVYDFIAEENIVYTVMDYIEGKSFDVLLQDSTWAPSQPEIINWACQLLEALCYLHSQPPYGILHGDIKPANVMLTSQGDIRLIDFNIALALGEEGAVQVGHSRGYASPEHYGIDYSTRRSRVTQPVNGVHSTTGERGPILLDVRSDIYCLGATLYHLLTGRLPAEDAKDVIPIRSPQVSPAVADIIQKAMMPDPDERYQTAQEMLEAFEGLHDNDPRTKRHRRHTRIAAAVLTAVFLAGGLSGFVGLQQRERVQMMRAELEAAEKTALAAIARSESAYRRGNRPEAVRAAVEALEALPGQSDAEQFQKFLGEAFSASYTAQAQNALTDALGVYELSDGFQSHLCLDLPGEPLKLVLSPAGTRAAVMADGQAIVFDTESGRQLAALDAERSALAELAFIDEDTLLYAGRGALRAYDLAHSEELWSGQEATAIALSADYAAAAAVCRNDSFAVVYDTRTGSVLQTVDFDGQRQRVPANDILIDGEYNLFALDRDGSRLAVSFDNGALIVYDLRNRAEDLAIFDGSAYTSFSGGFHGKYLALTAWDSAARESIFAVVDMDRKAQTGGFLQKQAMLTQADESGIYLSFGRLLTKLDPETFGETEQAYAEDPILRYEVSPGGSAILTEDGSFALYDGGGNSLGAWRPESAGSFVCMAGEYAAGASKALPELRILRMTDHSGAQVLSYNRDCVHTEARLSAEYDTVMLFRADHFWLYDMTGNLLADVDIPEGEDGRPPYDQQYRRDKSGSRLEVTYYSGQVRSYSAENGRILAETRQDPPDESLQEEFITTQYRIVRGAYGAPEVFDRESGTSVGQLQDSDTLIYVTEVGEYLITEYWSGSSGERYGLLMNQDLEVLARLPGLCDVTDEGVLLFDDMAGHIRKSPIYALDELIGMAKSETEIKS